MNLRKISFGNFKCLYKTSFEPGKVNVFIGANGSGKSTILEGIGLLSAAMTDRVDAASLQRKGVRLSVPALYKSNFKSIGRLKPTVDLSLEWDDNSSPDVYQYDVHLTPPTDTEYWKYHSEAFFQNNKKLWGRSNASSQQSNNYIGFFLIDDAIDLKASRKIAEDFSAYGIFQPNTITLRGTAPDTTQTTPIGLNGGRLAEAIRTLIHSEDSEVFFGNLYMDDILDMIDWAAEITVAAPKKSNINANVPTTRDIIEFTDRYMKDTAQFTGYDASEGALYVLFMLALAMHPKGPSIFAVDSFDHALNPRLAKKMMEVFCEQILQQGKHVFLTTHNPLVLDGLNLSNDDIRLFAVDRDANGYAQIQRIKVSQELIMEGQPLSRLWINGRLGGVPTLI
ncbi:hypothetical protein B5F07_07900 [Lachnoclostridium sp. An169]|uniref:AAA family ATPase n=1 Tax=Lachnoclostridium sp. An169 TaxID=1965569 RepID=UPI000B3681C6|nr:ATP-binding protein [Lachnoclostridium sp. An169]OUP84376.1 hypothetical protein B5F07_07900 [Lachnoclostridium sp. An169]HJA66928.1 AAA family ATPase [Candidatus Mediterraneibacter cottocaccae]